MDVSSVQTPGGWPKLLLGSIEVMKGNENRVWNSAGAPRASTIAVARRESRILVAEEAGVGTWKRRELCSRTGDLGAEPDACPSVVIFLPLILLLQNGMVGRKGGLCVRSEKVANYKRIRALNLGDLIYIHHPEMKLNNILTQSRRSKYSGNRSILNIPCARN